MRSDPIEITIVYEKIMFDGNKLGICNLKDC